MANTTLTQFPAGQTQYKINFDYLARPFVVVTLVNTNDVAQNRVLTVGNDYGFLNPTTIEIYTSQAGFDILQIHRFTSTELLVEFRDGSVLTATDLTNAELQAIHIAEEGRDQTKGLAKQYADQAVEASKDAQDILNQIVLLGKNGYTPVGSFENGGTVRLQNDVLQYGSGTSTTHWRWEGTLPKVVPAGSTPTSAGGIGKGKWIDVTDATLRGQLASPNGAKMVMASDGRTVEQWLVDADSAKYRAKNISKLAYVDYQIHNRGTIGVLFQGDSMTAGHDSVSSDVIPPTDGNNVTRASMSYPYRFKDFIKESAGVDVNPHVVRAISGYTAQRAYEKPEWQSNPNCDIVFLMYALNDAASYGTTQAVYLEYMEKLIRRFIDWGMAVVVQLPTCGSQGAGNPKWLHWARQLRVIADAYGCAFFNGHEVMLNIHQGSTQSDSMHFNSMGYAIHAHKLVGMLIAGGLSPSYRPVTNETTISMGMMSDSIGYTDAYGNIGTNRSEGAYTRNKIVGSMGNQSNQALASFSFYLDAEAAHISAKITGYATVQMNDTQFWNNGAKPYYIHANQQPNSYGMTNERYRANGTAFGEPQGTPGASQFLGRVVGRGWHTIRIFNTVQPNNSVYLNSITVTPVPAGFSVEGVMRADADTSGGEKMIQVVHRLKHPTPSGKASLPNAVTLSTIHMRCPQALLGTSSAGRSALMVPYFYNTGIAKLRVADEKGHIFEGQIMKTQGINYDFTVVEMFNNFPEVNKLKSVKATLRTRERKVLFAKGSEGVNQPLEDIVTYSGNFIDLLPYDSDPKNYFNGGLWLGFTFDWESAPVGYWTIEVEGADYWGNSEAMFGTL